MLVFIFSCFTPKVTSDVNFNALACAPIIPSPAVQISATLPATVGENNLSFPGKFQSIIGVSFNLLLCDSLFNKQHVSKFCCFVSFSSSAICLYSQGQKESRTPERTQPIINKGQSS